MRARLTWVRTPPSGSQTTSARLHKVEQCFELPFASVVSTCKMGLINLPLKVAVKNSAWHNMLEIMLSVTATGSLLN